MPRRYPSPSACRVPPALVTGYSPHYKGLSWLGCVGVANPGRIRPFPYPEPKSPKRHAQCGANPGRARTLTLEPRIQPSPHPGWVMRWVAASLRRARDVATVGCARGADRGHGKRLPGSGCRSSGGDGRCWTGTAGGPRTTGRSASPNCTCYVTWSGNVTRLQRFEAPPGAGVGRVNRRHGRALADVLTSRLHHSDAAETRDNNAAADLVALSQTSASDRAARPSPPHTRHARPPLHRRHAAFRRP